MDLTVHLDAHDKAPMYEQIYNYIKKEIKNGGLAAATRLPSTRELAAHLNISRSTSQMAYDQLASEGYIEAIPCKGYFVAGIEELVEVPKSEGGFLDGEKQESMAESADALIPYAVDFSPRGIALEGFPYGAWRKITKNVLVDDNRELFLNGDPKGEPALREAIRGYLHSARGVSCRADQIVVGAGSEYLLMLLMRMFPRNKPIAMENPTYKQAYRVFQGLGCRVTPVEMDKNGMDVAALEDSGAQIAYVMPSHQYPLGIVMPIRRRQELLGWARAQEGRYIIEDDYDSEFRYKGKPIPALQGMDRDDCVIYIGTFSRSIAPAIRISYLVLPVKLMERYQKKLGFFASTVSRIDQNVLYQFIAGGYYERHLNRMRAVYKSKHDLLLAALKPFEAEFETGGENAGVHILLTSKNGMGEQALVEAAGREGVRVYGLSSYDIRQEAAGDSHTVVLGYANLKEDEIKKGVSLLEKAWLNHNNS